MHVDILYSASGDLYERDSSTYLTHDDTFQFYHVALSLINGRFEKNIMYMNSSSDEDPGKKPSEKDIHGLLSSPVFQRRLIERQKRRHVANFLDIVEVALGEGKIPRILPLQYSIRSSGEELCRHGQSPGEGCLMFRLRQEPAVPTETAANTSAISAPAAPG